MSNTFLVLKDVHKGEVRVQADHIADYHEFGTVIRMTTKNQMEYILNHTIEQIDMALVESFYMVKRVPFLVNINES